MRSQGGQGPPHLERGPKTTRRRFENKRTEKASRVLCRKLLRAVRRKKHGESVDKESTSLFVMVECRSNLDVLILNTKTTASACAGAASSPTTTSSAPTSTPTSGSCAGVAAWSSATAYTGGQEVTYECVAIGRLSERMFLCLINFWFPLADNSGLPCGGPRVTRQEVRAPLLRLVHILAMPRLLTRYRHCSPRLCWSLDRRWRL